MDGRVDEIMQAVKEYTYDMEDCFNMLEDLKVEGFEDEMFRVYEGVRFLLDKKLEKRIGEILEAYEEKCECIECEDE